MSTRFDLGVVTAYAYAVEGGYTGTEAEFTALLGNIALDLEQIENLSVTVETLPAGSSATASYADGVLSLGIPKGDKGDKGNTGATGPTGATPDISIGTVTTGAVGSDAAATMTGTPEHPILNLTLPRGATGDVTNLADTFSSSKAYKAGEYVIYNDLLYVFTANHAAGAWNASHVSQVKVGGELTPLKEDLITEYTTKYTAPNSSVQGGTVLPLTGCIMADGTIYGNSNYSCSNFIEIGEKVKITAFMYGTDYFKNIAFYDVDKQFISAIGGDSSSWTRISGEQTIPSNAKYYRLSLMNSDSSAFITCTDIYRYSTEQVEALRTELNGEINDIRDEISTVTNIVENLNVTLTSGYMGKDGTTGADSGFAHTNKIAVVPGDVIRLANRIQSKSVSMRFVTVFRDDTAIASLGADNASEYTIPDTINYVVITGYLGTSADLTTFPYVLKWSEGEPKTIGNISAFSANGDMSDGDKLEIPLNNVSKNGALVFDSTVSAFSAVKIGRTKYNNGIRVTNSNVEIVNSNGTVANTYPHGLTIANTLSIRIYNELSRGHTKLFITVSSNGVTSNEIEITRTVDMIGGIYILSDGSSLTNCVLSFAPYDINKKLWVFGDSYFSFYASRWMGVLNSLGYADNVLVNAFAGEGSAEELPAFMNLTDINKPKFALWACGMNDGNDWTLNPNTAWKNAILAFITMCNELGIIPILATIPTVPSVNNEKKNEFVRDSGYRYIDFAKAVGASSSGVWYSGMLSNDNVHPTEKGAIALCNKALTDLPELMQTS